MTEETLLLAARDGDPAFRYASGFDVEAGLYVRFADGDDVLCVSALEHARARAQGRAARVVDRSEMGWTEGDEESANWGRVARRAARRAGTGGGPRRRRPAGRPLPGAPRPGAGGRRRPGAARRGAPHQGPRRDRAHPGGAGRRTGGAAGGRAPVARVASGTGRAALGRKHGAHLGASARALPGGAARARLRQPGGDHRRLARVRDAPLPGNRSDPGRRARDHRHLSAPPGERLPRRPDPHRGGRRGGDPVRGHAPGVRRRDGPGDDRRAGGCRRPRRAPDGLPDARRPRVRHPGPGPGGARRCAAHDPLHRSRRRPAGPRGTRAARRPLPPARGRRGQRRAGSLSGGAGRRPRRRPGGGGRRGIPEPDRGCRRVSTRPRTEPRWPGGGRQTVKVRDRA